MAPVNAHLCAQSLNVFGWQLRDGQKQVISAVVAGRVALAEIPDRIGEVAVHQVAGSAAGGLVVVVAPSVALQDDHVAEQRQHSNVPTVASINASPPPPRGPVHVPRHGAAGEGQRCPKASRGRRFVSRGRRSALRVVKGDDFGLVYRPLAGAVQRLRPLRSWRSPPPGQRQCGKTSSIVWGRVMRSSSRLAPTSWNCAWKWTGMNSRTRNAPPSSSGVPSSTAESMTIRHTSAGTAGSVALRGIGGVYHTL